ncbi:MAG: PaaI family thioesterase [Halobacteriaceae archaeon]
MAPDEDSDTELDPETEATRLDTVEQYLEHLRESTPYYAWLDPDIETVERGFIRARLPYEERFQPPAVAPDTGLNGGVIATLVDAVGMAALISQALEPVALATTNLSITFHDGVNEPHIIEGSVTDFGDTLATADVEVVPASQVDATDRSIIASGQTTARLFENSE